MNKRAFELEALINSNYLLPSYFGVKKKCPSGKNNFKSGKKWIACNTKKLNSFGKKVNSRKHILLMFKKKKLRFKTISEASKFINKITKKSKNYKKIFKILKACAKYCKIKISKKTLKQLWKSIIKVKKIRHSLKKTKSSDKVRKGRKLFKRKSNFGWWDNSEKTYALGCDSQQCGDFSKQNNVYPYVGDWKPYSSIRGPAFGRLNRYGRHKDIYFNSELGPYPIAVTQAYPFI